MARIGESAQFIATHPTEPGTKVPAVGDTFAARLIAAPTNQGLTLVGRGLRLPLTPANAAGVLAPGPIQVTVLAHHPQLKLRITPGEVPSVPSQSMASDPNGSETAAIRTVWLAMARAGFAFDPHQAARALRWINRTGSPITSRTARVAIEIVGRSLDELQADPAEAWLDDNAPHDDNANRETQRHTPPDARITDSDTSDLSAAITAIFKQLCEPTRHPNHDVQLYNHIRGPGTLHWVAVPFHLASTIDIRGIVRIGLEIQSGRVVTTALEARSVARVWWFVLQHRAAHVHSMRWSAQPEPPPIVIEQLKTLAVSLGIVHNHFDQFKRFDGFDADELVSGGVDSYG